MKWTKEYIIEVIQENSEDGYCSSLAVGPSCSVMARRKFGSFSDACIAAGVLSSSSRSVHTECTVSGCTGVPRSKKLGMCEMHYYRLRRTGSLLVDGSVDKKATHDNCVYCGENTNGRKHCSASCAARDIRGNPISRICEVCDSTYRPVNKGRDRYVCSDRCDRIKHRNTGINQAAKPRLVGDAKYETLYFYDILLKDSGVICGICGDEIDMCAEVYDKKSFTIDHIKRLSDGGDHTYENTQPAHFECNCKKH